MNRTDNSLRVRKLCVAALLCAVAILIPIVCRPLAIVIGPMSFTLGSHLTIFIAMFISPLIGIAVDIGASLGFLIAGMPSVVVLRALSQVLFVIFGAYMLKYKPEVMATAARRFWFGIVVNIIHGAAEGLVVACFCWFAGVTYEGYSMVFVVVGLVGFGTVVHGMIDYYLAQIVWRPVARVTKLPANYDGTK